MAKLTTAQLTAKVQALQVELNNQLEAKVGLEEKVEELQKALATTEAQVKKLFAGQGRGKSARKPHTSVKRTTSGVKCGRCSSKDESVKHATVSDVKACYGV